MAVVGQATVESPANIAFIKYWGNANEALRIPRHNSISMNVTGAVTTTTVEFNDSLQEDLITIDGQEVSVEEKKRVVKFLDHVRRLTNTKYFAKVISTNSFPKGAGIASSASAFSALALAAISALGLKWPQAELSALARLGSGSASRSIPDGFVEWQAGQDHETSFATSLYPANYWSIVDVIAIVHSGTKEVSSTQGHQLAYSSPLYEARVESITTRLAAIKEALANQDFAKFGEVLEADSYNMHAIMMTSQPSVLYWSPATVAILQAAKKWRNEGLLVYCTLDAGPNVHLICQEKDLAAVQQKIKEIDSVERIIIGRPTDGARVTSTTKHE